LTGKGLSHKSISDLQPFLELTGSTIEKISRMGELLSHSEVGMKGIAELQTLFSYIVSSPLTSDIELDLTLARGLNYYTGAIIEVKSKDVSIGSICGGGRYDNLTGVFGMPGVSGVGISFGADRIYDVLNQLNLFDEITGTSTQVLVVNFGESESIYARKILDTLHNFEVRSELYPDAQKLKKQISYADSKKIPYIIMAGGNEILNNSLTVKNMATGEQKTIQLNELSAFVKNDICS
jgi:histidyl-tRNA synthetase